MPPPPEHSPIMTHYDVLQVRDSADPEVVAAAAKALLRKHHPDLGGDRNAFQRVHDAYATLNNETKRAEYDKRLVSKDADQGLVPDYDLVRKISEGGFGEVYEARHKLTGMPTCIKMNLQVSAIDEELFLKEACALWDLRHHALPAVRDMRKLDNGKFAMFMSYVPGPTLEQKVEEYKSRGETIHPENVCWISERVLDALRYMHWHGVVHGDVKPQNIILQPDEHTCALVDFGLASVRPKKDSRADGYTPVFASPEALSDKPLLPESDLYSLGLTMIYAFGGDPQKRQVPKGVPPAVREYISDLIVYDVLSRPHWEKVDLVQKLREVRIKEFGRAHTNFMKV